MTITRRRQALRAALWVVASTAAAAGIGAWLAAGWGWPWFAILPTSEAAAAVVVLLAVRSLRLRTAAERGQVLAGAAALSVSAAPAVVCGYLAALFAGGSLEVSLHAAGLVIGVAVGFAGGCLAPMFAAAAAGHWFVACRHSGRI